jgi:hydrogenase maturation protease
MLIIGCGNRQRGDDAAGILVAQRLRELGIAAETNLGESADLLSAWNGADHVIIIDAVVSGAPVGTVHTWDGHEPIASISSRASTHSLGVAEAIELARVLNRLPQRLEVYGVEVRRCDPGSDISPEVQQAVEELAQRIQAQVDRERVDDGRH